MTPGVDPASPAHLLEAHTSARSSFARYELGDICGLATDDGTTTGRLVEVARRAMQSPTGRQNKAPCPLTMAFSGLTIYLMEN